MATYKFRRFQVIAGILCILGGYIQSSGAETAGNKDYQALRDEAIRACDINQLARVELASFSETEVTTKSVGKPRRCREEEAGKIAYVLDLAQIYRPVWSEHFDRSSGLRLAVKWGLPTIVQELLAEDPSLVKVTDEFGRPVLAELFFLNEEEAIQIATILLSANTDVANRSEQIKMLLPRVAVFGGKKLLQIFLNALSCEERKTALGRLRRQLEIDLNVGESYWQMGDNLKYVNYRLSRWGRFLDGCR